jgi:asparagine synthase (glutamine-hydrolysing)
VIKKIETFDTTTIRASTPQYLLAKKIQSLGFKVVICGEGADEAWGGYLYFHYAPNDEGLDYVGTIF